MSRRLLIATSALALSALAGSLPASLPWRRSTSAPDQLGLPRLAGARRRRQRATSRRELASTERERIVMIEVRGLVGGEVLLQKVREFGERVGPRTGDPLIGLRESGAGRLA